MRRAHDELEERRVIRLLARAAADVPELDPVELGFLISRARGHRRRESHRLAAAVHRARLLVPAAAASALAAAVLFASTIPASPPDGHAPPTTSSLVVFPEASALALLLADRPSETA